MGDEPSNSIQITLSPAQVDEVVRAASRSRAPSISTLIAQSLRAPLQPTAPGSLRPEAGRPESQRHAAGPESDPGAGGPDSEPGAGGRESEPGSGGPGFEPGGYLPVDVVDPRLSRSLLRGLALLSCFGPDGAARGIVELAGDLGMSPSTAHRYALTLVELGLLEQCPQTRKYRLPGI